MIRQSKKEDSQAIYDLIHSVELDSSLFLKAKDIESIQRRVEHSFVFECNKIIKGVILIDYKHFNNSKDKVYTIDNIVSKQKGVASQLLNHLPNRKHYCTISPNNLKSQALFKKHGFKKIDNITFMGYQREVYYNG
jgi:N-acetylglutamate synthase-like GNAT family acetyltransferase